MLHEEQIFVTFGFGDGEEGATTADLMTCVLAKLASAVAEGEKRIAEKKGILKKCSINIDGGDIDLWFTIYREYTEEEILKQAQQAKREEMNALFKIRELIVKYPHLKDKI